jgi:hypothetical protein
VPASTGIGEAASPAPQDSEKKIERVKVIVRKDGDSDVERVVVAPEGDEAGGAYAVFVGEDGEFEPLFGPGGAHGFHWVAGGESKPRGYLGAVLTDLTPELRTHFGAPAEAGVLVGKVEAGSPAEAAGLRVGDVITAVDGERVAGSVDIRRRIRALGDGETAALEVRRDGKLVNLTATVVVREVPEIDARRLLWRVGEEPGAYEVNLEGVDEAVKRMAEKFSSPDFQSRLLHLQSAESDAAKRLEELEAKLEALQRQADESRTEELEAKLEELQRQLDESREREKK